MVFLSSGLPRLLFSAFSGFGGFLGQSKVGELEFNGGGIGRNESDFIVSS
jgi:hypothetical protein